jgi:UDPglucose 6-dehydrogenase
MKIGFVGLSHLGIISSLVAASKGYQIVCYDNDQVNINLFKKGTFNIDEPNLNKYFKSYSSKIKYSNKIADLKSCEIVYFSEDIKTNEKNISDIKNYKQKINKVLKFLNKNSYIVVLSQVTPGFTESINWNKKKLFYQVETLIFGNAIKRASEPERFIIGSKNSKKIPIKFSNFLKKYNCPILIMNYKSAEITKISINLYLISQVSMTNILADFVKKFGADWTDISNSLRLDKRIGKHSYLNPGLGISGGNLERDLVTVRKLFSKNKLNNNIFNEYESISNRFNKWPNHIFKQIIYQIKNKNLTIGILGLAYKKNTHSIKNSPSIKFIKDNIKSKIFAFDPLINKVEGFQNLQISQNINQVIIKSNILIIFNDSDDFKKITDKELIASKKLYAVIDPYSVMKKIKFEKLNIIYKSLI